MGSQEKIRVCEIARDLGLTTRDLIERLHARGVDVDDAMTTITRGDAARVKRAVDDERARSVAPSERDRDPRSAFERELERARRRTEARLQSGAGDRPRRPATGPTGKIVQLRARRAPTDPGRPAGTRRAARVPGRRELAGRGRREFAGRGRRRRPKAKAGGRPRTTPAEHKRVIKVEEVIALPDLGRALGVKARELVKRLWALGVSTASINSALDPDTAGILAADFGYAVRNVAFDEADIFSAVTDRDQDLQPRDPVIALMGHVDHGKTTLLDYIRRTRIAAGESGGITQHIAAYRVCAGGVGPIVFVDTPGHEAFTAMRCRGAHVTDLAVLVVAATDGVMPQTVEALAHIRDAGVPMVVAVSKLDSPNARPDRVRQQLAERRVVPEAWGGETAFVDVSGITGVGIDDLLATVAAHAELLGLRANPHKAAAGVVIEAKLDRTRGPVATALVQEGTLRVGDAVVAAELMGKVRAMFDGGGRRIEAAGPSTPVEILGLGGVPAPGEPIRVTEEATARRVTAHRRSRRRPPPTSAGPSARQSVLERLRRGSSKVLKLVIRADVHGSAEALTQALGVRSTDDVRVDVLRAGVGGITESDVQLARASGALVVGFRVRPAGRAAAMARREGVEIRLHDVIYDAIEDACRAMAGLMPSVRSERHIGAGEVRRVFSRSRRSAVIGCLVTDGTIDRRALIRVTRSGSEVFRGRLAGLKRFKDDVSAVQRGHECGISIAGHEDVRVGDAVECFELVERTAEL